MRGIYFIILYHQINKYINHIEVLIIQFDLFSSSIFPLSWLIERNPNMLNIGNYLPFEQKDHIFRGRQHYLSKRSSNRTKVIYFKQESKNVTFWAPYMRQLGFCLFPFPFSTLGEVDKFVFPFLLAQSRYISTIKNVLMPNCLFTEFLNSVTNVVFISQMQEYNQKQIYILLCEWT